MLYVLEVASEYNVWNSREARRFNIGKGSVDLQYTDIRSQRFQGIGEITPVRSAKPEDTVFGTESIH